LDISLWGELIFCEPINVRSSRVSWNVRGLNARNKCMSKRNLLETRKVDRVTLHETKLE